MTEKSTDLQNTTTPAITYSECYRLPFLSLFHSDCMEIMTQYPDKYFDLAIVDPPYGIGASGSFGHYWDSTKGQTATKGVRNIKKEWDNETPTIEYFNELFRVSKNQIVWGGNYFTDRLPISRCWICYDKKQPENNSFGKFELAWTSFDKIPLKFEYYPTHVTQGVRIHPTQKPITLYDWILKKYAEPNQKIIDTHFGSGSIALAVDRANKLDNMNLHLTACEIDLDYVNASIKRISGSIKQGTLSF